MTKNDIIIAITSIMVWENEKVNWLCKKNEKAPSKNENFEDLKTRMLIFEDVLVFCIKK